MGENKRMLEEVRARSGSGGGVPFVVSDHDLGLKGARSGAEDGSG